jgi:pyrroloquinoline quinone (PQQ) biosynthesis protein C
MSNDAIVARLDAEVEDFAKRGKMFQPGIWTKGRCRAFVYQHRLNTRQRNSVLKLKVATNCPIWDIKLDIIHACAQEIIADDEFGGGQPHWEILEDLGVKLGMDRADIKNATPTASTQLCWDAWSGLMSNAHWLLGLIGNTCTERVNVPGYGNGAIREKGWFGSMRQDWREIWGLPDEDFGFFKLHTEADIEHSELGWKNVAEYAADLNLEDEVIIALRRNLVVWEHYLDGILAYGDTLED